MKSLVPFFILVTTLWTPIVVSAKNNCACKPIPESKTYQGAARKKKVVGYTIDWSCDFNCREDMNDQNPESSKKVRAFYHEYFVGEDGHEGVCEGVVYRMEFNSYLNKEVYTTTNEVRGVLPSRSKSPQLKKWSLEHDCE